MKPVTLGQKGCLNADLIIAQSQGVTVTIFHEAEDGTIIDHSEDTGYCRLQCHGLTDVVLDEYVDCDNTDKSIVLSIPANVTAGIAAGEWNWDLFVDDVRLVYGKCNVYDTYAKDSNG